MTTAPTLGNGNGHGKQRHRGTDGLSNRQLLAALRAFKRGEFGVRLPDHLDGMDGDLCEAFNDLAQTAEALRADFVGLRHGLGKEGRTRRRLVHNGARGGWADCANAVNELLDDVTAHSNEVTRVVAAVARGDLTQFVDLEGADEPLRGDFLKSARSVNGMVAQLSALNSEVTRVAREVGIEGKLGAQARVQGVSGAWKDLADSVNLMASNLTVQVREIARVTTAVAQGDLTTSINIEVHGEIRELKETINTMVGQLSAFADEVTRVAREVGTEGVLGGQAQVRGVSGVWKELTESVNSMAKNLTDQVRNISDVARAIADGDLSRKITVEVKGEILELKNTINTMVDQLSSFADEVTRVAREVGTEGVLGGQAQVRGQSGVWRELTRNVNSMAKNLTDQVRNIAEVVTAIAIGDLRHKITVDARGEILKLKNTINSTVDKLNSFSAEVTRVARLVGSEGTLGVQADVKDVSGIWRDLTDAVNSMAHNLTDQVRNISQVATAIQQGDLDKMIVVDARGEILVLKNTINTMVGQLSSFAEQVTRVAREVGTEGKLGGQASVEGVRGIWKELTDAVNLMASNLTNQVRDIAQVSSAIARGDLGRTITVDVKGEFLELKNTINTMVDQLSGFADEVTRVAREVGVEGKLGGQAEVRGISGIWKELTDNVNLMASNLTNQVRDIASVTTAVANGDLSRKITVDVRGEFLELKQTVNVMVDQLSAFADEVTRVAREVGTEGILGGQAQVTGVSGTWRELTDNVNVMARNLTEQVRGIAHVVTAVAMGDLEQKYTLEAKGEIATLVETINDMIVTLSTFADQVTSVAHDVGVEGRLGGQADVPGAAGVWCDLTNNVNELAGNLTRQVRAIGDVARAVTKGDLSRSITVDARGEVALLKDNINQMIGTLAETTRLNKDRDWLKTNLTRFTRMLQGQRDLFTVAQQVLSELAPVVNAQHGVFYMAEKSNGELRLKLFASYAFKTRKEVSNVFDLGEGLVGQAALEKKRILVADVPGDYIQVSSALGKAPPLNIAVVPILFEGDVKGVIELASFQPFSEITLDFLEQLLESLGIVVATIEATMRTDELLHQSQTLAEELQKQQQELQQTNEELEEKARQLTEQKSQVERKNREVELAKQELEEKAEQLALTSRYKSQFLANMSHELRTPLNSLLILSRQLSDNLERNLSGKQVEYAETIYQSGADLLSLINEVLDLAKIESGTMTIDVSEVRFTELEEYVGRSFGQIAEEKKLAFAVQTSDRLPQAMTTDDQRLRQVLRNLLSNAFKFTEQGSVCLRIEPATRPVWSVTNEVLNAASLVVAFSVGDTGVGIACEKQRVVFEAFQQADGGTSRRYGGTGLGLSISREIAALLGGEIQVVSEPGAGSTFTLYLPLDYVPRSARSEPGHASPISEGRRQLPAEADGAGPWLHVPAPIRVEPVAARIAFADDRSQIHPGDRVLLVIDGDEISARQLLEIARDRGFRGLVALNGAQGIALGRNYRPDAIILDLDLPDMDGFVALDQLKHDARTRHIPVHIMSADRKGRRGLEYGAIAFLEKPALPEAMGQALDTIESFLERRVKQLLVVVQDEDQRQSIVDLIGNNDVQTTAVASGAEALRAIDAQAFDCMVLDLTLPDMSGLDLIRSVKESSRPQRLPIIVCTDKDLTMPEETAIRQLAETIIIKDVSSPERLFDETALFLHRVHEKLPASKREMLRRLAQTDPALAGRKALIVDDDVRNIFALTALLEQHAMKVIYAENAKDALDKLERTSDIDVVLMDIMMPEMDGYEATRRIRSHAGSEKLPIIALTAKAMKGDREKCMDAGASDYITKPVKPEQLLSLLRVWLYR